MSIPVRLGACALIASGALALPAVAGAADITTAVKAVQTHTDRADAALDRAFSLFENGQDRAARRAFAQSRREMGMAKAAAAKARRDADTPQEHTRAAKAQALLADELDDNVEKLVGVLPEATVRDENKIASAARSDTTGREKAMTVLTSLLAKVPAQARTGIAKAISSLSQGRDDETRAEAAALVSSKVSNTSKRRVASALKTSINGQAKAADTLAALIASTDMPSESKQGLQTAHDAVAAEHGSVADILSRFSDRMPAFARTLVEKIVTQARTDAQAMRENHPTGPPAGTPGGATAAPTTPGGAPEETPAGAPASTPGGAPDETPAGPSTA